MEIVTIDKDGCELAASTAKVSEEFFYRIEHLKQTKESLLKDVIFDIKTSDYAMLNDLFAIYDNVSYLSREGLENFIYNKDDYDDEWPVAFMEFLDEMVDLRDSNEPWPRHIYLLY